MRTALIVLAVVTVLGAGAYILVRRRGSAGGGDDAGGDKRITFGGGEAAPPDSAAAKGKSPAFRAPNPKFGFPAVPGDAGGSDAGGSGGERVRDRAAANGGRDFDGRSLPGFGGR